MFTRGYPSILSDFMSSDFFLSCQILFYYLFILYIYIFNSVLSYHSFSKRLFLLDLSLYFFIFLSFWVSFFLSFFFFFLSFSQSIYSSLSIHPSIYLASRYYWLTSILYYMHIYIITYPEDPWCWNIYLH